MTKVIEFEEYKKLALLFQEAVIHLDWCGYGDSYERKCARDDKLPQRLDKMLARVDEILELNKGEKMNNPDKEAFEKWLRTVCFQKPTPEAYDLAWQAWRSAQPRLRRG